MLAEKFKDIRIKFKDIRIKIAVGILISLLFILMWYFFTKNIQTTNNATIQCEWSDVSPEVPGIIEKIHFSDNEYINTGDVIVSLESTYYTAQLARLDAEVTTIAAELSAVEKRTQITNIGIDGNLDISHSSAEGAKALSSSYEMEVKATQFTLDLAKKTMQRLENEHQRFKLLYKDKYVSAQQFDASENEYLSSVLKVEELNSRLKSVKLKYSSEAEKYSQARRAEKVAGISEKWMRLNANVDIEIARGKLAVAEAERNIARLNLDRTQIKSRASGKLTNRRVSVGQHLQAGQPLASVISCKNGMWVEANFKETQLEKMRPGQKVLFEVDMYPGVSFEGVVDGISDGSGSTFSVLPPENATGNFTKVVQRFTTKIKITSARESTLRVGMSATVTVYTDSEVPLNKT